MAVGVVQEPPVVVVGVPMEGEPRLPQLVCVAAAQGPVAEPLEQELGNLAWRDVLVGRTLLVEGKTLTDEAPQEAGTTFARAL